MLNWLIELCAYTSARTIIAFVLGLILCILIHNYGEHAVESLKFTSPVFTAFENVIRSTLEQRYDKIAWGSLFLFWGLGFKLHLKDKKRWERF